MLCCYCQKNQATKSRENTVGGVKRLDYYCFECYDRLFLHGQKQAEPTLKQPVLKTENSSFLRAGAKCNVCGRTEKEFLSTGIVGCAKCYENLASVKKAIVRMQGTKEIEHHRGKSNACTEVRARMIKRRNELQEQLEEKIAGKDILGANRCKDELKRLNAMLYAEDEV